MPERNTTDDHEHVDAGQPGEGDPISKAYDAWQRSSARLLELERSLVTHRSVDPNVEALIKEVKVLRSCTVELFVQASSSVQKEPPRRAEPPAKVRFSKGSARARESTLSYDDPVPVRY